MTGKIEKVLKENDLEENEKEREQDVLTQKGVSEVVNIVKIDEKSRRRCKSKYLVA